MRNPILFFSVFFFLYALAVYYVSKRTRQGFSRLSRIDNIAWYVGLFFLSVAYFIPRIFERLFSPTVESLFSWGGGLWLAIIYYGALLFALADLFGLLISHFTSVKKQAYRSCAASVVWIMILGLCVYGGYNAMSPVVTRYELTLPGKFTPFTMAAVSDIHLGRQIGKTRLARLTALVNEQHPDVIALLGDTIDDDLEPVKYFDGAEGLRRFSAPWGVYAIMGNHEYLRGRGEEYAAYLKTDASLRLLRDEFVLLPNGVALIGRDDVTRERMTGRKAISLAAFKQQLPDKTPVIVMDHNPGRFPEAVSAQLPLMISGHTHVGQLAPNQYALRKMYPIDYGVLESGFTKLLVSSGFGTWGPPIRVGNHPEIMLLHISPSE